MAQCRDPVDLLVVCPWLATWRGGDATAHFDALPMRVMCAGIPPCYTDLSVLHQNDDGRRRLHLDGFRAGCQVDDRHVEAYAWFWATARPGARRSPLPTSHGPARRSPRSSVPWG